MIPSNPFIAFPHISQQPALTGQQLFQQETRPNIHPYEEPVQQIDGHKAHYEFQKHTALAQHYERLRMENANNHHAYYRYAELQHYHLSRSFHFRRMFTATSFL